MLDDRIAVSVRELCRLTGLSRSFFYAEWAEGRGPRTIKVAGRTLVRVSAIERWLDNQPGGGEK